MGINYEYMRGYDEEREGFTVRWYTTPCEDEWDGTDENGGPDLETIEAIANGTLEHFDVKCEVSKAGVVLGTDYLGGCCYESFSGFVEGESGYHTDMIQNAMREARANIAKINA